MLGVCTCSLVRQISSRVMEQSGDNQFSIQKVAINVQHGNAASVMAIILSMQDWAEFAFFFYKSSSFKTLYLVVIVLMSSNKVCGI